MGRDERMYVILVMEINLPGVGGGRQRTIFLVGGCAGIINGFTRNVLEGGKRRGWCYLSV